MTFGKKALPLAAVTELTSYSKSSIYRMMKVDNFPHPHKIGARRVAWCPSEVNEWLKEKDIKLSVDLPSPATSEGQA